MGLTKSCSICKNELPIESFKLRVISKPEQGYKSACRSCSLERRRVIYHKTKQPDSQREKNLKKVFGISVSEYESMLKEQGGSCKICGVPAEAEKLKTTKRLAVDHCHSTGRIRGLLCRKCNTGLGNFNDDINLMTKAINYLKEN